MDAFSPISRAFCPSPQWSLPVNLLEENDRGHPCTHPVRQPCAHLDNGGVLYIPTSGTAALAGLAGLMAARRQRR